MDSHKIIKNTPFYLFVFCLFFAPLAFGTVEQWSLALLEISVALAFTVYFFLAWFNRTASIKVVGLLPLSLLMLVVCLQLIPLPPFIIKTLFSGAHQVYQPVVDLFDSEKWIPLSVNRKETLHELLRLTSYIIVYVLTIQLLSSPHRLKSTVNSVVFLGAFVAFLAIIQDVTSHNEIYWFRSVPVNSAPFGPWINPNQFSGYMELVSPLALALFLFYRPRLKGDETLREKFVSFFSMPGIHFHLFIGFGLVLMVFSIFVSLCRGGILSICAAGIIFLFLYNIKFPKRGRGTFLVIIICIILAISWFGWDTISSEFLKSFDNSGRFSDGRLTLWADIMEIIKQFPLLGAGFGSFLSLYPSYKTINDKLIYDHAHNDYLELLTDGGVVGFVFVAWFLITVLLHGWRMVKVRNDHYAVLLGLGAISGIAAILAHSITDFNLHNGAVGFYFFFVCGLLIAGVNSRFIYNSKGTLLQNNSLLWNRGFAICGTVAFGVMVLVHFGAFWASYRYKAVKNIYVNVHLSPSKLEEIRSNMVQAVRTDPWEGLYSSKLGSVNYYLDKKENALADHLLASYKNPLQGEFLQQLGLLIGDEEKSKELIEEGYSRALSREKLAINYAEWLMLKNRRVEALDIIRRRLSDNYTQVRAWMPLLNAHDVTLDEIKYILPESTAAWLYFGKYCRETESFTEADFFLSGAMSFIGEAERIDPQWYIDVIAYFNERNNTAAIEYVRQAVEMVPENPLFHIMLGDHYRREGITYRAKEEYEQVLFLEPGNPEAQRRLRKMGFEDAY